MGADVSAAIVRSNDLEAAGPKVSGSAPDGVRERTAHPRAAAHHPDATEQQPATDADDRLALGDLGLALGGRGSTARQVAVQPWWRDYAVVVMSGGRAGGSHAPVVNSWVIASRVLMPHLVAVDR
jgi:hypothetical protein